MTFMRLTTLPAYCTRDDAGCYPSRPAMVAKWSGAVSPPAIGAMVPTFVGPGEVTGYFVDAGWLGLWVRLPNGTEGTLFGAEIDRSL